MSKDLSIAVLLTALLGIYAFGFFGWPYMPKNNLVLYNLYYISVASAIYGLSMVIFIIANSRPVKIVSCLWVAVSSAALYNEVFLNPTNWTYWSAGLIAVVLINLLLTVSIIEKIKSKRNGISNNNN